MRNYYPKGIDHEVYRRAESIAHSYCDDLRKIRLIENELIHRSPSHDGTGHGSGISNPTAMTVEQIEKHTKLLREHTSAVERALSYFDGWHKDFLKQNFLTEWYGENGCIRKGVPIIYCNVDKSEIQCKRIRYAFICRIAYELGEIL